VELVSKIKELVSKIMEMVSKITELVSNIMELFLSFRHVLNVIYSFLGNFPASEF